MPEEILGPLTVTSAQVSGLGAMFTAFVNALLRAELAIGELSSVAITTTDIENIGDEGVDVGITRAIASLYIPAGDSAWQFKRGDLAPAACKTELAGATQALEVLRGGGRYRLVLGVDINDAKVRRRRKALIEQAQELGIELASEDAIEVLTASDLANWAEHHPSLAVSHLVGGIRGSVEAFEDWAGSDGASTKYVESDRRKETVQAMRQFVAESNTSSMRIEGVSGLGKSRTVLEAVRGQAWENITVYVRDADKFPPSLIRYLSGEGRVALIVVDECDARTHKNLAGAMPSGTRSLRLALAESENYANNASGVWTGLFGVMLPNTAASPHLRLAYLNRVSQSDDPAVRRIAGAAAKAMVQARETTFTAGERQHGVMVERRGTPATYGDVWAYQKDGIKLLQKFVEDAEADIANGATEALIGAIHPFLEYEPVRDDLFQALATLPGSALRRVRTEVTHLAGLFTRVSGVEGRQAGLELLIASLPAENPDDHLRSLLQTRRWDLADGELQQRITEAVRALLETQSAMSIVDVFDEERWEAAFEFGYSLAIHCSGSDVEARLAKLVATPNMPGLTGYLQAQVDREILTAFDDFIDGPFGKAMTATDRLHLSVRGPKSERGWARTAELLPQLSPREGVVGLFGWHIDFDLERLDAIINDWLARVAGQDDYDAVVDFAAMALHRNPAPAGSIENTVASLVQLRRKFPNMGQQGWDWTQLAKRQLDSDPAALFETLLDLIEADALHLFSPSEETDLVRHAVEKVGMPAWEKVMAKAGPEAWRVQWDFRGWLAGALPAEGVIAWIGEDLARARLAAPFVSVGDGLPSPVLRNLLHKFGTDSEISSSLATNLISNSGWGRESVRWNGRIAQLESWVSSVDEPKAVKHWATDLIKSFEKERDDALRREAEGDW